jgi:hypothetical protein
VSPGFASLAGAAAIAALAAGCAANPAPVQVVGAQADVAALAGEWTGEYSSAETGRAGSIVFRLNATGDTAAGDVVMIPRGAGQAVRPAPVPGPGAAQGTPGPTPQVLTIRFVRVSGGRVSGVLDPYVDPECGCILRTTFSGRVNGDRIEGEYASRHTEHDVTNRGQWAVTRRR